MSDAQNNQTATTLPVAPPHAAQPSPAASVGATPPKQDELRTLVIRIGDLLNDLEDKEQKELRSRLVRLVSAVDVPGRRDDVRYRTEVAYAVQDLEKSNIALSIPSGLRAELGHLATTYPGLQNDRMQQMVAGTPDIASAAIVKAIRATAAEIAGQPDQNTPSAASRIDALANRVRLGTDPTPNDAAAPAQRSAPAQATATPEQAATAQAQTRQDGQAATAAAGRPGSVMQGIMAALRRNEPEPSAPWDRQLTPMGDRITAFHGRMQAGAEDVEMRRAERSGLEALTAVKEFTDGPGSVLMGRIRDAAKADPQGIAGVLSEMRDGERYAGLRQDFNVAVGQEKFATAYDRAASAVTAYGANRAEVDKFAAQRPDAAVIAGRFQNLDAQIGKAASEMPSKEEGKSFTDELAERAREIVTKAMDVVTNAFNRLRPSSGPSPAP